MDLTLLQLLTLLAVGVFAGIAGGLLGVGGGIVMIPAMTLLLGDTWGPDSFHVYNLAAISTAMVLSIPAAFRHTRARAVVYPFLPSIVLCAVLGVVGGVWLGSRMVGEQTRALKFTFGAFLEFVVCLTAFQEWRARRGEPSLRDTCPLPARRGLIGLLVGVPSGFIAGLLGIGGGVWAVPALSLVLGLRLRNAIATSTVMIIGVALVASIGQTLALAQVPAGRPLHGTAWLLMVWLAPGALIGGWLGAGLTHRLPVRVLRYVFLVLLAVTGWRLMRS